MGGGRGRVGAPSAPCPDPTGWPIANWSARPQSSSQELCALLSDADAIAFPADTAFQMLLTSHGTQILALALEGLGGERNRRSVAQENAFDRIQDETVESVNLFLTNGI